MHAVASLSAEPRCFHVFYRATIELRSSKNVYKSRDAEQPSKPDPCKGG